MTPTKAVRGVTLPGTRTVRMAEPSLRRPVPWCSFYRRRYQRHQRPRQMPLAVTAVFDAGEWGTSWACHHRGSR